MRTILLCRFKVTPALGCIAVAGLLFCIQGLRALPGVPENAEARKRINADFMLADGCYQALRAHPDELFSSLKAKQSAIRKSMDDARSALNLRSNKAQSTCSLDLFRQELGSLRESLNALTPVPKSPEATAEKNIEMVLAAVGAGDEQAISGAPKPPAQTGPINSIDDLKTSLGMVINCVGGWKQNGRAVTQEGEDLLDTIQQATRQAALNLGFDAEGLPVKEDCTEPQMFSSLEKAKGLISALPETTGSQYGQAVVTESNGEIQQAEDALSRFEKLKSESVANPGTGNGRNDESTRERLFSNLKSRGAEYLSLMISLVAVGILLMALLRQTDRKPATAVVTRKTNDVEGATLKAAKAAAEKVRSAVQRIDEAQARLTEQLAATIPAQTPATPPIPRPAVSPYEGRRTEIAPPAWQQSPVQEPVVRHTHPQTFPDLQQPDGPVADFNECLTVGINDAEDHFIRKYGELMRLTCVNLQEHRNPNATLRFKTDGRGNFMVVLFRGQMMVLPAIGVNPNDSRKLLEGVFQYPSERVPVRLASPAKVASETADTFVIRERGAFERA